MRDIDVQSASQVAFSLKSPEQKADLTALVELFGRVDTRDVKGHLLAGSMMEPGPLRVAQKSL